jgi:hypothetical protein
MDPCCTGTSGLRWTTPSRDGQQAQSWGADCGSSATSAPCLPSGDGDGWACRASIRHSLSATAAGGACHCAQEASTASWRAAGRGNRLQQLGAVQAAGGQSQRAWTSSHAPCGRPKPCGWRLSNGEREHQHQHWVSLGLAGQVARRAGGLAPRCSTAAVVTAAADWRRRVKVQVELQRAIHPDEGGSGVGE